MMFPYYMGYPNVFGNTQDQIDAIKKYLDIMLGCYHPPKPKSGRKVYRDLGDCWIVIAHESGPLKLLELEMK